jgi:hypothetical protein
MPIALFLIVLGVFSRLIPHPSNFVAIGAIALFAGAKLPKRWAFVVPLAIYVLSDLFIDAFVYHGFHFHALTRLTGYAMFTLVVALGRWKANSTPPVGLAAKSVAGSTLFFLASNFAVWMGGPTEGLGYPQTLAGLGATYAAGLPFFKYTLAADLLGTGVLFGVAALFDLAKTSKPVADELS